MIHAPFSRSAQRERVLKVLELSQCSKRRQIFEDGCWVLRTYRGARRRLSRTLRERLPKKKEIDAQNDNRVQTFCSLTVMGYNSVYECRWRCDGPQRRDCGSKPSVMRRPSASFFEHGRTSRRFSRRVGGQRRQDMCAEECMRSTKECQNPHKRGVNSEHGALLAANIVLLLFRKAYGVGSGRISACQSRARAFCRAHHITLHTHPSGLVSSSLFFRFQSCPLAAKPRPRLVDHAPNDFYNSNRFKAGHSLFPILYYQDRLDLRLVARSFPGLQSSQLFARPAF
jgi:hypothetical protein